MKRLYRFALFADSEAVDVHVYGFVVAQSQDEAFRVGDHAFPLGDSLDEARRWFDMDFSDVAEDEDDEGPFFSVNEIESYEDLKEAMFDAFPLASGNMRGLREVTDAMSLAMVEALSVQGVRIV